MSGKERASRPISAVHAMMGLLELQSDASRLNLIVNHPDIYPWVRGFQKDTLDLTSAFAQGDKLCLLGKYGGVLFHRMQPGLYEAHTQILPEGRGAWALDCVRACLMWLFTRTDAMEVMTRCPDGNLPAKALARAIGGRLQFNNPQGWVRDDNLVPADIYSLTIQDWTRTAEALPDRGRWFHKRLDAELARLGTPEVAHPYDANHDRYVGAACEMILGGQPLKAECLYNRFAVMGGYAPLRLTSLLPLQFDIGTALLEVRDGDFSVVASRPTS